MHALLQYLKALLPLLAVAAVCIPAERLSSLHKLPILRKGWKTDIAYLLLNGYLIRLGLAAVFALALSIARQFMPHVLTAFISAQPLWAQIAGAILIGDFALYWAHRGLHANRVLWRFHSVHHAVEALDWVAAYHAHPIDDIILAGAAGGAVYMLGFSPAAVAAYFAIYSIVSVGVHMNTRLKIGPLRWIVGSPEFHHWHHSNETDARDRNFAAIVSFWDVLFGTAYLPPNRVPQLYGIAEPMPDGYADQLCHPFRSRIIAGLGPAEAVSGAPSAGLPGSPGSH